MSTTWRAGSRSLNPDVYKTSSVVTPTGQALVISEAGTTVNIGRPDPAREDMPLFCTSPSLLILWSSGAEF